MSFHLTGKKAPKYFVYRKAVSSNDNSESHESTSFDAVLKFDETQFERGFVKRMLGVQICMYRDDESSNKYGYFLKWESKRPLSSLSYRLQELKYVWDTHFIRRCVQAYVVGKIQFAASLYWLRACPKSIDNVRFDYCMAMAAVVGVTTPEVVGMFNCKTKRVSKNCKGYLNICKY